MSLFEAERSFVGREAEYLLAWLQMGATENAHLLSCPNWMPIWRWLSAEAVGRQRTTRTINCLYIKELCPRFGRLLNVLGMAMVDAVGIEPTTCRLRAECSAS